MKPILKIAKAELLLLFYSPVAWLIFVIFTLKIGLDFSEEVSNNVRYSHLGYDTENLTAYIFNPGYGLFKSIQDTLMLGMPFLTMGLMSREISSGTLKLLLSSPVSSFQIIAGKYLAIMIYCLGFLLIIASTMLTSNFVILHQDNLYLLSGLFGSMLLIGLYAAVGLFMSSITSYQIVAAISTIIVFQSLNGLNGVWQRFDFFRQIPFFLEFQGKIDVITNGFITSSGVLYFLILTSLFLILIVIGLEYKRRSKPLIHKVFIYCLIVSAALYLGYLSSRPSLMLYADLSRIKKHTIVRQNQDLAKTIKDTLYIHSFANILDEQASWGLPYMVNYSPDIFKGFQRYLLPIKYDYTLYYDTVDNPALFSRYRGKSLKQIADKVAELNQVDHIKILRPEQMHKSIDTKFEENRTFYRLQLNGKSTNQRFFNDNDSPGEENIGAALKRLTGKVKTIAFVTGNGERDINKLDDDRNYKHLVSQRNFKYSLLNYGFDIDTIDISKDDVPKKADILVIADPEKNYSPLQLKRINNFITSGGNLLIMGDAGKQNVLNPICVPLGLAFLQGRLIQRSEGYGPEFIIGKPTVSAERFAERFKFLNKHNLLTEMPNAMGIKVDNGNFKVDTIITTDPATTWNTIDYKPQDTLKAVPPGNKPIPLAVALSRTFNGRQQKVMVIGDANFMDNASIRKTHPRADINTANFDLAVQSFYWLSDHQYPVDITRPDPIDNKILIGKPGAKLIHTVFLIIIPGLLLLTGGLILFFRMRN